MSNNESTANANSAAKKQNPLWNILINIVFPSLILVKLSDPNRLGPVKALVLALLLPIAYGIYEIIQDKKINAMSVFGLVSVLVTGALGLLQLEPKWFAVKEAAFPLLLGIVCFGSVWTRYPLFKTLFFNPAVINISLVENRLQDGTAKTRITAAFNRSTIIVSLSFLLSAVLNFILTRRIVTSSPGSTDFNEQLGRLTALSFPVIALPCMVISMFALWYLIKEIKKITGLTLEQILNNPKGK